jgi:hypothetical protein
MELKFARDPMPIFPVLVATSSAVCDSNSQGSSHVFRSYEIGGIVQIRDLVKTVEIEVET